MLDHLLQGGALTTLVFLRAGAPAEFLETITHEDLTQQLQQLQPLLQTNLELQQQQQQLLQQQKSITGSLTDPPELAGGGVSGLLQYPPSGYSCSVQSFDDFGATDSAGSSPRSRSSYAASSQHQPPSR